MTLHLLKRAAYAVSLLGGLVVGTFVLFQIVPADPARTILGPNAPEAQVESFRRELGLDRPVPEQLIRFVGRAAILDFGHSHVDRRPVGPEVADKLSVSLVLVGLTLLVAALYVAGSASAAFLIGTRLPGWLDFFWVSMPSMFSGVAVALAAAHFYPVTSFSGRFQGWSDLLFFVPPAAALALYPMAILSRILRAEVRRLSGAPFIAAARAAGYPEWRILCPHILKSAMVPVVAALSAQLPMLFTGAFIVEAIFSIPGTGTLLIRALLQRDMPMLQAIVLVNGCVVLAAQFLMQLLLPLLDPRARADES